MLLGQNMVALLAVGLLEKASIKPILVQVVPQAAITKWCKTAISSWNSGDSEASNLLVDREVVKSLQPTNIPRLPT